LTCLESSWRVIGKAEFWAKTDWKPFNVSQVL
jgi:hypothetical protein